MGRRYNAARGLISRDIAHFTLSNWILIFFIMKITTKAIKVIKFYNLLPYIHSLQCPFSLLLVFLQVLNLKNSDDFKIWILQISRNQTIYLRSHFLSTFFVTLFRAVYFSLSLSPYLSLSISFLSLSSL